jgi:site-specific DNA-methyltransferase (adenine-specific)
LDQWHHFFRDGKVHIKHWAKRMLKMEKDYLKYGSIYGEKYAVVTDHGEWDSDFTMDKLEEFVGNFYRVLKNHGTCIIFFDLWKITDLKNIMEKCGFQQIRLIEWVKTNPQPLNSKRNYLTNCREIALLGVKKGKPTFNSEYDKGIYSYPIAAGKDRWHSTQKSLPLFEDLVNKHSNEGDLVLDCFLGSGTTAVACLKNQRKFTGCEVNEEYCKKSLDRVKKTLDKDEKLG